MTAIAQPQATGPDRPWRPGAHHPAAVAIFVAIVLVGVGIVLAAWHLPPFASSVESRTYRVIRP
jgi:hypothetical protein